MLRGLLGRSGKPLRTGYRPRRLFAPDARVIGAGAVAVLAEGAETLGIGRAQTMAGLEYLEPKLTSRRAKVSWDELCRAFANLEAAGVGPEGFERIGQYGAATPHLVVSRIADFFIKPQHVLFVGVQWAGPALFPVLAMTMEYDDGRMRVTLELPQEFPGNAAYFHVCKGTFSAVPKTIGHPRASVHATITSHRGEFDVEFAPFSTGLARLRRLGRAMISAPLVIRTLAEQEEEVRRSFEAALDAETQFRRILDALPDAVIIARNGVIDYANPALAHTLGYGRGAELVGASLSSLASACDRDRVSESRVGTVEARFDRRTGGAVMLELSPKQSIVYEGARAELTVARDVTERRDVATRLALADKMASLGTLAAGVAHEINNPLALVLTNLQLAERGNGTDDVSEYVSAATEGALRVREIVRDLRVFSQPEHDAPESVDLGEVVASSLALARGKVRARAKLVSEIERVPPVVAGRGKLGQVVLNLVINAVQALPANRPTSENHIVVRLHARNGSARIEVEDNGAGIPLHAQPHVFEPFFTTKHLGDGSGLGLAVAHGIVTGYGGELSFRSQIGVGTTFIVELPIVAGVEPAAPRGPDSAPHRTGGRVLIVDDEPALARVVQQLLVDESYDVVTVGSGNEAIAILDKDPMFDAVLCDLMMEHGSGVEVYAHVIGTQPEMARRIIFMTGGTFRPETRDFLARVTNHCLDKPFNLDELIQTVSRVAQH